MELMSQFLTGGIIQMELEFNQNTIGLIAKKINESVGTVVQLVGLKSWTSLVQKTPVGNPDLWKTKYVPAGYVGGQAKFSWNAQYNKPDTRLPISWGSGNPTTPKINVSDDYNILFITSSAPHMEALEKGHSTQGKHMIKRTVGEINLELKSALR